MLTIEKKNYDNKNEKNTLVMESKIKTNNQYVTFIGIVILVV